MNTVEESQHNGELVNGDDLNDIDYSNNDRPKKTDIIRITGKLENCEKAKEALLVMIVTLVCAYEGVRF